MTANKKLLILPGDGIGREVMAVTERVMDWYAKRRAVTFDVEEGLIGGCSYDAYGTRLSNETLGRAKDADAGSLELIEESDGSVQF